MIADKSTDRLLGVHIIGPVSLLDSTLVVGVRKGNVSQSRH